MTLGQLLLIAVIALVIISLIFTVTCAKYGTARAFMVLGAIFIICYLIPYALQDPEKFALCVALTLFTLAVIRVMLFIAFRIEDAYWEKILKEIEEENKQ